MISQNSDPDLSLGPLQQGDTSSLVTWLNEAGLVGTILNGRVTKTWGLSTALATLAMVA